MSPEKKTGQAGLNVSDEAVKAKTGKDWGEWFAILDAAGAQAMDHKQIVAYLVEHHQVGPWWRQMVTVSYEQARGLREKHEMPQGYQISRSRTIGAPLDRLFAAWEDPAQRARWLPGDPPLAIRPRRQPPATPGKSLRATWGEDGTNLEIYFYPKGENKVQVTAQHSKLPDADRAQALKTYWAEALKRLEEYLLTQY
jgi:uncharacterized protein YndB with AHSA1/START domain